MLLSELIARFELTPSRAFADVALSAVRALDEAQTGDLSFLTNLKYKNLLQSTQASAVLVDAFDQGAEVLQLKTSATASRLSEIMNLFHPEVQGFTGIHASAWIDSSAEIGEDVVIGVGAVIESDAIVETGCIIGHHCVIGAKSRVGARSHLFPGVVLYPRTILGRNVRVHAHSVIGSDGFGYAQEKGQHVKIPQIGRVVIGDNVEIGSHVCIDRGAIKDTQIGSGTKIDNLVQIAHGVVIGEHAMVISQSGIAGSAELGKHTTLAGQVGVNGHIKIADGILIMGKSVVTKSLNEPGTYAGNPAIPVMKYQRQLANLRSLDKLRRRIKELENQLNHES